MTADPLPRGDNSRKPSLSAGKPVLPRPLLLGLFIAVAAVALYLYLHPILIERQARGATLAQLQEMARREENPRILYHLGLKQREQGDAKTAFETLRRAALLDIQSADIWVALAESARMVEGDQSAFNILGTFVKNNPRDARGHVAMARLYMEHRSWNRAREEASLAAKSEARNAEAWRIVGQAALAMELARDAEPALRRAVALAPGDWENQAALGDALAAQDRYRDSIPVYQEAVRLAPNEAVPPLSLGRALLKADPSRTTAQELSEAENNLRKSIELRGDIPVAYTLLGQCLAEQKRLPEARAALEKARDLAPADPDAYFQLARVAAQMGDSHAAAEYQAQHDRALQQRNTFGDRKRTLRAQIDNAVSAGQEEKADGLRRELARFLASGEEEEAMQIYGQLVTRYPNDASLLQETSALRRKMEEAAYVKMPLTQLLAQADSLLAQKQYPAAEKAYTIAFQRDPKNGRAAEGIGLALQAEGHGEEATYYLISATKIDPKLSHAHFALAERYRAIGFPQQAVDRYQKVIAQEPGNALAWDAMGQVLRDRDSGEAEAEQAFQHAVSLEPNNVDYLLDLADIQDTNNKKMQAETTFRRALALNPRSAEVNASLGAFLVNNPTDAARREEAARLLSRSLELDPNDDYARFYQGKLALDRGDVDQAISLCEAVLKKEENGRNREIWYTLGRAYTKKGDRAKAEKALAISNKINVENVAYAQAREQLSLHPTDPQRHLAFARTLVQRGDNARAIREYERTLSLEPKNAVAQKELAAFKARLEAEGRMPSMATYDALMSAAYRHARRDEPKPSPGR